MSACSAHTSSSTSCAWAQRKRKDHLSVILGPIRQAVSEHAVTLDLGAAYLVPVGNCAPKQLLEMLGDPKPLAAPGMHRIRQQAASAKATRVLRSAAA